MRPINKTRAVIGIALAVIGALSLSDAIVFAAPNTPGYVSIYPSGPYVGAGWATCNSPITWYVDTSELRTDVAARALTDLGYAMQIWGTAANTPVISGGAIPLMFDNVKTIAGPAGPIQGERKIYVKFVNNSESTYLSGRVMGAASPTFISPLSDEIVSGSAVFRNDYFNRATNRETIALFLHELGHVFGLGHSTDPKSVMFATVSNTIKLNASDLAGIRAFSKPCPSTP